MVGYVLLVTSAVVMGVIVYQWIKTYVPTEALECPDGVSIFLKEYYYDCGLEELTITLKNNGRFNLAGYFIHATNISDQELATIDLSEYITLEDLDKGGTILFGAKNLFEPGEERTAIFDLSNSNIGKIYSVEIIPVRFQEEEGKERFASCGKAKVKEVLNCGAGEGCVPDCTDKECGDNGCGGSCGSCTGEEVCNSEGECISEEQCTDSCSSFGYECGTWTICGVSTNCGSCTGEEVCNSEGICEEQCTTHSYTQCYNNDVYWYDSCDIREDIKEDCGTSGYTGSNYCYNNDVYRDYVTRGCSDGECTSSTGRIKQEECGDDGCEDGECQEGGWTVICTELYNLGYLTEKEHKIELKYGSTKFSPEALRGYHAFAIPAVKAMRENPETIEYILPLVKSFTEEMAYRLGEKEIGNEVGELFLDKGLPLFERIGVLINEPDWESLFNEDAKNEINTILQDEKYDKLVQDHFTKAKIKEIFYNSLERSESSDILFADNLVKDLKKIVEEIELEINLLEHPDILFI